MRVGPHGAPGRRRLLATAMAMLLVLSGVPAAAEDLEAMKRRAAELIRELEGELQAVRDERRALQRERDALQRNAEAPAPGKGKRAAAAPAPAAPPAATAKAPAPAAETETARKVDVLTDEVAQLKENLFLPEKAELKSFYGLGPAASKVYQVKRGLSIGGYGEGYYSKMLPDTEGEQDRADAQRFVLYTGYKFTDRIILNTEVEVEHATTESTVTSSGGAVSLEFGYLDFLGWKYLNARAGLVLMPLGFINEIHEPVYYFGNFRPQVERVIIPTTWSELGTGIFGQLWHPDLQYRTYVSTSLNAEGFEPSGIREGRQAGNRALAEDLAWSARLDYTPHQVPGLLVGASTFMGDTSQNQEFAGQRVSAFLRLSDLHLQYNWRGVWFRGLYAFGSLNDAEQISQQLNEPIGSQFYGYYLEAAYDFMPIFFPDLPTQSLQPFFRYERYNPQQRVPAGFRPDETQDTQLFTVGISYKPHPQVVLKLDYRNFTLAQGERPADVNVGLGFIF
jgi:hypothetical protein